MVELGAIECFRGTRMNISFYRIKVWFGPRFVPRFHVRCVDHLEDGMVAPYVADIELQRSSRQAPTVSAKSAVRYGLAIPSTPEPMDVIMLARRSR